MGLRPKKEYVDKISLEWFAFKFQNLFYRLRIGPIDGQRSLNRLLLENVQLSIPDKDTVQLTTFNLPKCTKPIRPINGLLLEASTFFKSNMVIEEFDYREPIDELFHLIGGNSGLTEEFAYYNSPSLGEKGIPILSGATVKDNLLGYVSRNAKPSGKKLKIFFGPAILIVRKGNDYLPSRVKEAVRRTR
jgi:hypothetical protein